MKFLILFLVSFQAFAVVPMPLSPKVGPLLGHDKGNGGFAISCLEGKKQVVRALDLYEAKDRVLEIMAFDPSLSATDIALKVVAQLDKLSPLRAAKYREQILSFFKDSKPVGDEEFVDVGDIGAVYKPDNCFFLPAVVQKRSYAGDSLAFFVHEKVWPLLSKVDQAALIVHEIVYFEFGHSISTLARSFVGTLFSKQFQKYKNTRDFYEFLVKHRAPYFEQGGVMINLDKPHELDKNQLVKTATTIAGTLSLSNATLNYGPSPIEFYSTGYPKFISLNDRFASTLNVRCMGDLDIVNNSEDKVFFHSNGQFDHGNFRPAFSTFKKTCDNVEFSGAPELEGAVQLDPYQNLNYTLGVNAKYTVDGISFNLIYDIQYDSAILPFDGTLAEPTRLPLNRGGFFDAAPGAIMLKNQRLFCATSNSTQVVDGVSYEKAKFYCLQ